MTSVSVCMATYNGVRYLREQVTSILSELGLDDELVVQDDCSSDSTVELIEAMSDPRVRLERNGRNLGVVSTVERALERATGDVVVLADQDDIWLPGRVREILALHERYDLVVVNCRVVDGDLNPIAEDFFSLRGSGPGVIKNLYRNSFLGCCMSFRRGILKDALPFPRSIPMHDMWIGLVGSVSGSVFFFDEKFVLYRRHSGSVSPTATGAPRRSVSTMLKDRWQLVVGLGRLCSRKAFGQPGMRETH